MSEAPGLLDKNGRPIPSAEIDVIRAQAIGGFGSIGVVPMGGSGYINQAYHAGGIDSQDTANWWPTRSSADGTILPAKDLTLARVRDVIRNDPIASAAVDRLVDLVVGPGLRLSAKPDGLALGIKDPKALRDFARSIQSEWRLFAEDPRYLCDAQRRVSMNGLFRLLARTWIVAGETTAVMSWRDAPGQRYSTCVLPVDPDRLSNPNGVYEQLTLRGGVEMDLFGAPIAYHVRNAHIGDWWASELAWTWTRVPRETSWGRPVFIHGFEPDREGQTRAISPFASLIQRLRMIGKHADSELASAAVNALFTAFVETDLPTSEVQQRMAPSVSDYADKMVCYYSQNPAIVGGQRIPVMLPGTKVTMNSTPRQTASFDGFQTAFLRSIAAALGISYEQLSMDWSKTNYSSARAALNEVWRAVKRMSAVFVEQVVTPIYYAFLEEAFDKGYLKLPKGAKLVGHNGGPPLDDLEAFLAMPGAFTRARWIGPGRGYVDPVKEAEGATLRMEGMFSTLEKECAEQGDDYEDTLDQIANEEADLKERGLTRMSLVAAVQSTKGPKPDSEEAEGPAGPGGIAEPNK
ncbi:Phage portal protein [Methylocella tundrae]|uniref:Phage portal protein n=1 Tax=Methylocella tundrae TaxID=227605 RepID=A0A8B6MDD8_METTU|nr:phage portal protein [Methylocella tundrae]VTZ52496.1 Phage portal protein [Methylocella tundrae]